MNLALAHLGLQGADDQRIVVWILKSTCRGKQALLFIVDKPA
jgi:hypothetical protein